MKNRPFHIGSTGKGAKKGKKGEESWGKDGYGKDPYGYWKGHYGKDPYGKDPYGRDPYGDHGGYGFIVCVEVISFAVFRDD